MRPEHSNATATTTATTTNTTTTLNSNIKDEEEERSPKSGDDIPSPQDDQSPAEDQQTQQAWPGQASEPYQLPSLGVQISNPQKDSAAVPTALNLLLSSSIFKSMRERASVAATTEAETRVEAGVEVGCQTQFLEGPQEAGLYDETNGNRELFSQGLHHELSFSQTYGPPAMLGQEEGTAMGAPDSQGASYWDPFIQPLGTEQLTSC